MPGQHTSFILKILNGINSGASVRLKTGSVILGRSMNSDIILHDENIADQHARLQITPDTITIYPIVQPVLIDDQEAPAEGINLLPQQRVKLGTVDLMVVDSQNAASASVNSQNTRTTASAKSSQANAKKTNARISPSIGVKSSPMPGNNKTYLLIGLGLLLLGNIIYFAPNLSKLLKHAGVVETAEQKASSLLEGLGKQDFTLKKESDGSVSLRGYSRTNQERDNLLSQINNAGLHANVHIWSQEEMVANATTIARSLGEPGIQFAANPTLSALTVSGFVSKTAVWERIRGVIQSDVGGVQKIEDAKLQSLDGYLASFVQFVEKNGLSGRLKITTDGKKIIVGGELTQQEIEKVGELKKEFVAAYGPEPPISLEVVDVRSRIKLAIRSVSVGKTPYIVAKDGKKYMQGSAIGENYFIKAIRPDHVVLVNNGMEIPFYYGIEEGRK